VTQDDVAIVANDSGATLKAQVDAVDKALLEDVPKKYANKSQVFEKVLKDPRAVGDRKAFTKLVKEYAAATKADAAFIPNDPNFLEAIRLYETNAEEVKVAQAKWDELHPEEAKARDLKKAAADLKKAEERANNPTKGKKGSKKEAKRESPYPIDEASRVIFEGKLAELDSFVERTAKGCRKRMRALYNLVQVKEEAAETEEDE
jgi:hypothetical protein